MSALSDARAGQDARWAQWMAAAQDGDGQAYNQLLREITPFARALVRRAVIDPNLVEDAVQDVLLTVHRVRHTYAPDRPFSPWLAAIAHRRAVDVIRRQQRIRSHETWEAGVYETFSAPAANQPEEQDELSPAQIAAWLAQLPPAQRQAFELLKLQGLSLAEAAASSGQSVGALKVSVHRAIKTLRGWLRQPNED